MKILLLIAAMLMLFSSCSEKAGESFTPAANEKYKMSDLPASAYYLGEDTVCFFPYNDKIYKAGNEVGVFDIESGMSYTKLCDIPDGEAYSMCVTSDGIFLYSGSSVSKIGFDGEVMNKYALPEHDGKPRFQKICVTEKYIVNKCRLYPENEEEESINCIWVTDRQTGDSTKYEFPDTEIYSMSCLEPGEKPNEVFIIKNAGENVEIASDNPYDACVFDAETGKIEKIRSFDYGIATADYIAEENKVYFLSDSMMVDSSRISFNVFSPEADETFEYNYAAIDEMFKDVKTAVKRAGADLRYMDYLLNDTFVTGYDIYMWDEKNKAVIVNDLMKEESGQTLTILYPKAYNSSIMPDGVSRKETCFSGEYIEPNLRFEEEYNVKVTSKDVELAQFNERMRMKFLANEDDFDIVYHDNVQYMLPQLLGYQLYLPLENYEKITSAYDNDYIEGVKNIMSWDGHIYGVPYKIDSFVLAVSEDFEAEGITAPDKNYTLEDFWNICEEVYNIGGGYLTVSYGNRIFNDGLMNMIEDAAAKGSLEKDDVVDFIEKYLKYKKEDILTDERSYSMLLSQDMQVFIRRGSGIMNDNIGDFVDMRAVPSPSGKQYYDVESIIYANHLTKNPDLCGEYLALLMSKEFASEAKYSKTMFWKNPDDYHTRTFIDEDPEADYYAEPTEDAYTWVESPVILRARENFMLKYAPNVLGNAAPRLYSYEFDELLCEIREALGEGTMTPDEAAEKLCEEVNYRMLE